MKLAITAAAALLLTATFCQAADTLAGKWGNGDYAIDLTLAGDTVAGSFTHDTVTGTIAGTASSASEFKATWQYSVDGEPRQFQTWLALTARGRTLSGYRWTNDDDLQQLALTRIAAGAGEPITEDSDLGAIPAHPDTAVVDTPQPETPTPVVVTPPITPGRPQGDPVKLFDNGNLLAVVDDPTSPTVFELKQSCFITEIHDYHWNSGRGATPGKIALQLQSPPNTVFGPWDAKGENGMGRQNISWVAAPNTILPPGKYRVYDTDPETWSHNTTSGGAGFVNLLGLPVPDDNATAVTTTTHAIEPEPTPEPEPTTVTPAPLPRLKLLLATSLTDDHPAAPATRFSKPPRIYCFTEYAGLPEGTATVCVWTRDGKLVLTDNRTLGGDGWVWFSLGTADGSPLKPGKYTVKLRTGETLLGYQEFVVE